MGMPAVRDRLRSRLHRMLVGQERAKRPGSGLLCCCLQGIVWRALGLRSCR